MTQFAQQHQLTVNTILQGVWAYLLTQYTQQQTIVFGATVTGRPASIAQVEERVGLYINTLPVLAHLEDDLPIIEGLRRMQEGQVEAQAFQYTSMATIQEMVDIQGELFDSLFVFENFPIQETSESQELKVEIADYSSQANLMFTVVATMRQRLHLTFKYNATLITEKQALQIQKHFTQVLLQILEAAQPNFGDLDLLTAEERQQILVGFNQTQLDLPNKVTLVDLFEQQVKQTPHAVALVDDTRVWTYAELDQQAQQLARQLQARYQVKSEELIGLMLQRSAEAIIGILGILKSAAAYVPIDPKHPVERKQWIIKDTAMRLLLINRSTLVDSSLFDTQCLVLEDLLELPNTEPLNDEQNPIPTDLAYLIYTSGSTGQPKGVMIEHRGIANTILAANYALKMSETDRGLQFASLTFDASVWEIFTILLAGGTLHIISDTIKNDSLQFADYLKKHAISTGVLPPTYLTAFEMKAFTDFRVLVTAGEAANQEKVIEYLTFGHFCNAYGPTEVSICASLNWIEQNTDLQNQSISIGRPLGNVQMYILNARKKPVPIGVVGELYIGGNGLARGYLNRPQLNEKRFIAHPFDPNPEARLYRTGDLARWLPNGEVDFIGRRDNQVKIRGFRIELGEIEHCLLSCETIEHCAVLAQTDTNSTQQLVAYVSTTVEQVDEQTWIQYLKERLPQYMIPVQWIRMTEMPLTTAGKIDRQALAKQARKTAAPIFYVAPRNGLEYELSLIWQQILGHSPIGVTENFFQLGGHSVLAMRLIGIVRKRLQYTLPLSAIFDHPTIAALAHWIRSEEQEEGDLVLKATQRPALIPLSFAQQRLWFIDQLEGSVQYHIPEVLRLKNQLNRLQLELALRQLVERHEVLRTTIQQKDGQRGQVIQRSEDWHLSYTQIGELPESEVATMIQSIVDQPFDLAKDFPFRAHLLACSEAEHVLVLIVHHIASDGWSQSILVKDLLAIYQAIQQDTDADLVPLSLQYADFAIWQQQYFSEQGLETQLQWWQQQLNGVNVLELPTDFARPLERSHRGGGVNIFLSLDLINNLRQLAREQGASLFMVLIAAFKVLLFRHSGQSDICVGTPVANRDQEALTPLVGFFINTLALRTQVEPEQSFIELLAKVKQTALQAFDHQLVPFEQIVDRVSPERHLGHHPIFQVLFVLQNTPKAPDFQLGDLELISENPPHRSALFDLNFSITETNDGARLAIEYSTDLYSAATIERMGAQYQQLLQSIVDQSSIPIHRLSILPDAERRRIEQFNTTSVAYPDDQTVVDWIASKATLQANQPALFFEGKTYRYQTLNETANQVAHWLKDKTQATQGTRVAVMMQRSDWSLMSMLAVMKLGGLYIPIDGQLPPSRIRYLLENSETEVLLLNGDLSTELSEVDLPLYIDLQNGIHLSNYSTANLNTPIRQQDAIALLYTSGSTGQPKGVLQTHRMYTNLVHWTIHHSNRRQGERFLLYASFGFDMSLYDSLFVLSTGGQLYLTPDELTKDLWALKAYIIRHQIANLSLPFSVLKFLFETTDSTFTQQHAITEILSTGEQLYINGGLRTFLVEHPQIKLYNFYGPSETHGITCIAYHFANDESVPVEASIGRPINNHAIHILDAAMQQVPIGVEGELYIEGHGLALGYQ
ncbi:MAG: amino acid adenylation domain-containing protein, partial [Bacteroidota bacterium]